MPELPRVLASCCALVLAVTACGGVPIGAGSAPGSVADESTFAAGPLPEDRVVLGDFSELVAVAAGSERVWVVTPDAVVGWDYRLQRWDGPYDPGGPGALAGVRWAAIDPLDQSLWLAGPSGWVHWQPDLRLWDAGRTGEAVQAIAFDEADPAAGLYFRTARGWLLLPRGSALLTSTQPPIRPDVPSTVAEALRANPSFAVTSGSLLDDRMRPVRITAAAESWDGRGWFFATAGAGLLFVEQGIGTPEQLRFGLPGDLVGALYAVPGGVWVATDRIGESDAALTFVGRELERFETVSGGPASGLPFTAARAIVGRGDALWVGTDAGVVRVLPGETRVDVVDELRGLPDPRVLALANRSAFIEVGTQFGLARVDPDSLRAEALAPNAAPTVYSLAARRDTTWVGTSAGVRVLSADGEQLLTPRDVATASLSRPVLQLAWAGDTLVALTRDAIFWRDPAGAWTVGPDPTGLLGELGYLAVDDQGVWIAGDAAIGHMRIGAPAIPVIRPDDVPGRVTGMVADDAYLWVGTTRGLVRFRIAGLRP